MRIPLLILSILGSSWSFGQELTLSQALQNAKHTSVSQATNQQVIDDIQLQIQKSKRLPLIYGDANLQRNLIVPVTPVPAIAFNPNAAPGEITPLRFATDWSAKAGLQFSMDIFNPDNQSAIREAKYNQSRSQLSLVQEETTVQKKIIDGYAQVVLAMEQADVASAILKQYEATQAIINARYEAGRIDIVEKNTAQTKYLEVQQLYREAQAVVLNKQIALLEFTAFDINDSFVTPLPAIKNTVKPYEDLTIAQLKLDQDWATTKINNLYLKALPKLTLNGYYGAQYFDNSLKLFNNDQWFGNSFINLSLRVPITEHYERSLLSKRLKAEYNMATDKLQEEEQLQYRKQLLNQNTIQTHQDKITQLKQTVALAQENVQVINEQVTAGRVLVTNLNNAIEQLLDQQKKLWQAEYDYINTLIDL